MDNRFKLRLVTQNILSRKLRSALTVAALMIGVSTIIYLVSFAYGIEQLVSREISGSDAFELVDVGTGSSQIMVLDDAAVNQMKGMTGVEGAETVVNAAASLNGQTDISLFGVSDQYLNWSGKKTGWGEDSLVMAGDATYQPIIVNTSLVNLLENEGPDTVLGDVLEFNIVLPKELVGGDSSKVVEKASYEVVGVVKDNLNPHVFVPISSLLDQGVKRYSQVKLKVVDRTIVSDVRRQIENMGYKTEYLGEILAEIEKIFVFFKLILGSFGLIALIVACLGMFNTLTIALLERTKEIALLKVLGIKRRDIFSIFLTEALIIGLIGSVLGIVLGMLMGKISNLLFYNYALQAGNEGAILFAFTPGFLLSVLVIVLGVALLTGLYPSTRASMVNALDILRHE